MMMTNQKNHQTKPNTSNQMKPNTSNLIAALNKFQASNTKAERDGVNPYFKSNYATLDEVIECCNYGAKFGLAFSQQIDFEKDVVDGKVFSTQFVRTTVYHTSSEQAITSRHIIAVKGNRFDDSHAVGSAITYAKRYSLLAIYGLATQDDDGNANSIVTDNKSVINKAAQDKKEKDTTAITYVNNYRGKIGDIINDENKSLEEKKAMLKDYISAEKIKLEGLGRELPGLHKSTIDRVQKDLNKFKEDNNAKSNGNKETIKTI